MNEHFDKIISYLKEENAEYDYDEEKEILNIVVGENSSGNNIYESITYSGYVFCSYMSIYFDQNVDLTDEDLNRMAEFFHRANYGMIRGNFEFDFDRKIVRFKHYFDKSILSDKDYTMFNIVLPVKMFTKYTNGLDDILTTNIPPKEIIKKIESESSNNEKDT